MGRHGGGRCAVGHRTGHPGQGSGGPLQAEPTVEGFWDDDPEPDGRQDGIRIGVDIGSGRRRLGERRQRGRLGRRTERGHRHRARLGYRVRRGRRTGRGRRACLGHVRCRDGRRHAARHGAVAVPVQGPGERAGGFEDPAGERTRGHRVSGERHRGDPRRRGSHGGHGPNGRSTVDVGDRRLIVGQASVGGPTTGGLWHGRDEGVVGQGRGPSARDGVLGDRQPNVARNGRSSAEDFDEGRAAHQAEQEPEREKGELGGGHAVDDDGFEHATIAGVPTLAG